MLSYILLVSVLHTSTVGGQPQSLNRETLQIQTNDCTQTESDIRDFYRTQSNSRVITLKCLKVN